MNNSNYFKDIIESFHDFKKVSRIFLIQNDENLSNLSKEIGFSKNDINLIKLEFRNNLLEGHEDYISYIKNEEEAIIERNLNK